MFFFRYAKAHNYYRPALPLPLTRSSSKNMPRPRLAPSSRRSSPVSDMLLDTRCCNGFTSTVDSHSSAITLLNTTVRLLTIRLARELERLLCTLLPEGSFFLSPFFDFRLTGLVLLVLVKSSFCLSMSSRSSVRPTPRHSAAVVCSRLSLMRVWDCTEVLVGPRPVTLLALSLYVSLFSCFWDCILLLIMISFSVARPLPRNTSFLSRITTPPHGAKTLSPRSSVPALH